ncbi:MAG: hypothetical protein ACI9FG_001943, partial [Crocinitomicaceae bacterium]
MAHALREDSPAINCLFPILLFFVNFFHFTWNEFDRLASSFLGHHFG